MERLENYSKSNEKVMVYCYYEETGIVVIDKKDYENKEKYLELLKKFYMSFMDEFNPLGSDVELFKCNDEDVQKFEKAIEDIYNSDIEFETVEEFEEIWDVKVNPLFEELEAIDDIHEINYCELFEEWSEEY